MTALHPIGAERYPCLLEVDQNTSCSTDDVENLRDEGVLRSKKPAHQGNQSEDEKG